MQILVEHSETAKAAIRLHPAPQERRASRRGVFETPWAVVAVMGAAVLTRFLLLNHWSLWQDEETSLYFSQNLTKPFPTHVPLFFLLLRATFAVTGVSVIAGRVVSATLGVVSILLVYQLVTRLLGRAIGVLASTFVVLSLGHLFWSQSIRYYTLLLVFQWLSAFCFIDGFEKGKPRELVLASIFLFLGALSHLTVALLLPVFVAHLTLTILMRDGGDGYNARTYAAFAVPFVAVAVFLYVQRASFQTIMSALNEIAGGSAARPWVPLFLLGRLSAYLGPPAIVLSLAAPMLGRGVVPGRLLRFFTCLAFVPIAELLVVLQLGLGYPLWYQAFVSVIGIGVLAAVTLYSLRTRGYRHLYRLLCSGAIATSLPLTVSYYTTMHGDRARFREAVQFVARESRPNDGWQAKLRIYSSVPGVTAFYLGYDPSITMNQSLVVNVPADPPAKDGSDQWFIVEQNGMELDIIKWLRRECNLLATYEARTGPRDRTVFVYRRRYSDAINSPSAAESVLRQHFKQQPQS